METLHDADRGGFIFAPEVGLHENVHELDFSLLYPNIICTRNVSPDVIRCDCRSDREDVPGLGYSICDDRDYLVDVLQPIIDARDEIKAAIRREEDRDDPDVDDEDCEDLQTLATEITERVGFVSNTSATTTGWRSCRSARATPAR